MNENLLTGKKVRLTAEEPAVMAEAFSRWGRDSEYVRLLDDEAARLWSKKKYQDWIEKDLDKAEPDYFFSIRSRDENALLGFVALWGLSWNHGEGWVAIAIGERQHWGQGYGTDAMCLMLRYAFEELNLHRVSLGVFEYNTRAIRSYEKAGFVHEGIRRRAIARNGRRYDFLQMGVLQDEWEKAGK